MKSHGRLEKKARPDVLTLVLVAALLLFGLVILLNALSDPFDGTESDFASFWARLNFEYFDRQVANILISLLICLPLALFDYHKYKPLIKTVYFISCILLIVLVIAGDNTRGVLGWYKLGTSRAFQPSEICKITMIVMLSKSCAESVERHGDLNRFTDVLWAFLYFAVPFVLVLLQGDFGTAMVYAVIFVVIVFSARIGWRYILGGAVVVGGSLPFVYKFALNSDQKLRIRVFLDPTLDPEGAGYNVLHAKEIIGSGGLWGKGLFTKGTLAQTGYVPEWHTDFIFSTIGESLGFAGCAALIAAYCTLLIRWVLIAINARDLFGRCLAMGCMAMMAAHVFENIGMNLGLMPVTGIPLPFISYGGSNMLASLAAVSIVLSVHYRTQEGTRL